MTEQEEVKAMAEDGLEPMGMSEPQSDAPVQMPPEEEAAMKFTKLLPYVSKLSSAMPSKGGLVRVLTAMAEFPIGSAKPRFLNESERQLFLVLQELQGYKSTVLQSFIRKQSELNAMKQQIVAAEVPVEESGEQNGEQI